MLLGSTPHYVGVPPQRKKMEIGKWYLFSRTGGNVNSFAYNCRGPCQIRKSRANKKTNLNVGVPPKRKIIKIGKFIGLVVASS